MTENKIMCSADEYAWMENLLKSSQKAYDFATTKAKPGSAVAASAQKHLSSAKLYTRVLSMFAVRPGSVQSEGGRQQLSVEFQKAFSEISGTEVHAFDSYEPIEN